MSTTAANTFILVVANETVKEMRISDKGRKLCKS
jgi:hypothetical protein